MVCFNGDINCAPILFDTSRYTSFQNLFWRSLKGTELRGMYVGGVNEQIRTTGTKLDIICLKSSLTILQ